MADSHFLPKFWKINPEEARDSVPTLLEVEKNIIWGRCLPYGLPFCEQNLSFLLLINQVEEFFFSSHFVLNYAMRRDLQCQIRAEEEVGGEPLQLRSKFLPFFS